MTEEMDQDETDATGVQLRFVDESEKIMTDTINYDASDVQL